jgi:RNA polymerase sigma factor (sigma-70 family)
MRVVEEVRVEGDFAGWVSPHLPPMARVAARLSPAADRDDVVQEALARAWRRRSTFDPARGTPAAWLAAVVAGEARRARGRTKPGQELVDAPVEDTHRDLDLERAVAQLSQRQREAVDLHYFTGLTVSETAAAMGCADGTVKSTLSDARVRLRILLGEDA